MVNYIGLPFYIIVNCIKQKYLYLNIFVISAILIATAKKANLSLKKLNKFITEKVDKC